MRNTQFAKGSVIASQFVIESEAGSGGMGTVFRGRDLNSGTTVAIKLLNHSPDRGEAARFLREAHILSELRHPGIVAYISHGYSELDIPFLVMEWLDGEDLSRRLRGSTLSLVDSLDLLRSTTEALDTAHRLGVVHRDLKPSNIFLRGGEAQRATLLDFGIARAQSAQGMTKTGTLMGTPEYMAPEQARCEHDIGPAADIFSVGCVFFHCLVGRPPFFAEHMAGILAKILFEEAPSLRSLRPELPDVLDELLGQMLAKAPTQRIPNAGALLERLKTLDIARTPTRTASTLRQSMVDAEQQLVSVIIATAAVEFDEAKTIANSIGVLENGQRSAAQQAAIKIGAHVDLLPDGSLVASIIQHGHATVSDQAAKAARCALLIKDIWPGARLAMATGRGILQEGLPAGEAIDKVGKLLTAGLAKSVGDGTEEPIRIDEVTAQLLDARFTIHRASDDIFLLMSENMSSDELRPLLGKPTPCVGREQELSIIEAVWSGCIEESERRVALVVAEPGMGKSRLRHEFLRRLHSRGDEAEVLIGRGDPMRAGSSYGLLGQALRTLCGVREGVELELRQQQLSERIGQNVPPAKARLVIDFLGEMCGVPFSDAEFPHLRNARQNPRLMNESISDAFVEFLRAEAALHPVLLILEDLHWGDRQTIRVIDAALSALSDQPLMVLGLARPEIHDIFPKIWSTQRVQEVRLAGLSKRACERLVKQVLGPQLPASMLAQIVQQADGNALYLEELIRAASQTDGDTLPPTVLAMLQSRLARLDAPLRRVLRAGSVFGQTFWRGGVAALLGSKRMAEDLGIWLEQLINAELIQRHPQSQIADDVEYGFHHGLAREAAYSMLLDSDRRLGHSLAAEYLESVGNRDPMLLAEHYQRGGAVERAAAVFLKASEQAFEGDDLESGLAYATRGVATGVAHEPLGNLLCMKAAVHFWRGELGLAEGDAAQALQLLPADSHYACKAIATLLAVAVDLSLLPELAELHQRFLALTPSAANLAAYTEAGARLIHGLALRGDRDAVRALLVRLEEVTAETKLHTPQAWRHYSQALYHYLIEPSPWATVSNLDEAWLFFSHAADWRHFAMVQVVLGAAQRSLGICDEAEITLRGILAVAERLHEQQLATYARANLCQVLVAQTQDLQLEEVQSLGLVVTTEADRSSHLLGLVQLSLAQGFSLMGDWRNAEAAVRQGQRQLRSIPTYEAAALATLLQILVAQSRLGEAEKVADEAEALLARSAGLGHNELRLRVSLAEARNAGADKAAFERNLQQALQALRLSTEQIPEPEGRELFLTCVAENTRLLALANLTPEQLLA